MATYVYRRSDGTEFETKQGMNDAPLTHCPDTGLPVKRVISGGLDTVFVGSKWPDKQIRSKERIQKDPYATTLSHYEKKIQKNTEKAREIKAKHRVNITEV